jgi:phosphatidylserine/phosphatidylglycerophosphate/cardiolipin synthase-like enzyme
MSVATKGVAICARIINTAWPGSHISRHYQRHLQCHWPHRRARTTTPSAVTVCFTPGGNCTDAIVKALGDAKRTVLVQAYSFTSAPIAKALLDAHKRGVQVQVILDKSQRAEKYSSADFLANQGMSTMIDANHAIAHNKVIVIDGETVITGSFNFTKAAQEKNAENALILRDPVLAAQYTQNWEAHRQHSQPYVGRGIRP